MTGPCFKAGATAIRRFVQIALVGALCLSVSEGSRSAVDRDADLLLVVDCLLPGQVRSLGQRTVYLSARRPARLPARDCQIRGGEYVAFDRATMQSALAVWLPAAREGDIEAAATVGEIFERGIGGGAADYGAAIHWYRLAAERGSLRAQINLGHMYETGLGVAADATEAARWYRLAAGVDVQLDSGTIGNPLSQARPGSSAVESRLREQENRRLAAESRQSELEAEVAELRRTLAAEAQSRQRQLSEVQTLRAQLEERQRLLSAEEAALEAIRAELRSREDFAAQQIQAAESLTTSQIKAKSEEQQALRLERQELLDSRAFLEQERVRVQAQLEEVRQSGQSAEAQRAQVASEQVRLGVLQEQLVERESQLAKRESALLARLDEETRGRRRMEESLASAEQDALQLRKVLSQGTAELDRQRAELADMATQTAEKDRLLQRSEGQLAETQDRLNASQLQAGSLQREAEALREEVAALRRRLEAALAEASQSDVDSKSDPVRSQAVQVEMAGPSIAIIDPEVLTTRGVMLVAASAAQQRQVVGRVQAPGGLLTLTINDEAIQPNDVGVFSRTIEVHREATPIRVVAIDQRGKRAEVMFTIQGPDQRRSEAVAADSLSQPTERFRGLRFGNYHALVIGNNSYRHITPLKSAVTDARDVAAVLEQRYGFKVTLLLDADRYAILSALNALREQLSSEDNLLIYYAGHGELDTVNNRGHWLPVDAERGSTANWIPTTAVTDILNVMQARQILLVVDSCYSGALTRSSVGKLETGLTTEERRHWVKTMLEKRSRTVLTSGGLEPVLDSGGGRNSVFAKAFLQVLREYPELLDGQSLHREVSARVAFSAADLGFQQVPEYAPVRFAGHESGEFFLVPQGS